MERSKLLTDIRAYFGAFREMVKGSAADNRLDNAIDAEHFLAEMLNVVYGWNLVNANDNRKNEAGIDLCDTDNRIVFQITTAKDKKRKIAHSFDKTDKRKYEGFRFCFFFIDEESEVDKLRSSEITAPSAFSFSPQEDIYSIDTLICEIAKQKICIIRKVREILKENVGLCNHEDYRPQFVYVNGDLHINNEKDTLQNDFAEQVRKQLNDYVHRYKTKYRDVYTLLHSEQPIAFSKTYYPQKVRDLDNNRFALKDNIGLFFAKGNFVAIEASAGSGKTMLMKYCYLTSIETTEFIPILVEFRNIGADTDLIQYIKDMIFGMSPVQSPDIFYTMLRSGQFLFILDGYDEIADSVLEKRMKEIEKLVDDCPENCFLLTTRPGTNYKKIHRFCTYYICELESDDISGFIDLQCASLPTKGAAFAEELKEVIADKANENYKTFLENPLLLSMLIFTFSNRHELPRRRVDFYSDVFDELWVKHDSRKEGAGKAHGKRSGISEKKDIQKVLGLFCYLTYANGIFTFDEKKCKDILEKVIAKLGFKCRVEDLLYDLHVSISIICKDVDIYYFPHRSMQEYFVAHFIKELSAKQKINFYEEKMLPLSEKREIENLWKLIEEFDKHDFYKYFFLEQLDKFVEETNLDNSDLSIAKDKFIEVTKPDAYVTVGIYKLGVVHVDVSYKYRYPFYLLHYLKCTNLIQDNWKWDLLKEKNLWNLCPFQSFLTDYTNDEEFHDNVFPDISNALRDSTVFLDVFAKFRDEVLEIIENIRKYIEKQDELETDFFDIDLDL